MMKMYKILLAGSLRVKKSFKSIVQKNLGYTKRQQLPELIGTMTF